ncbi:hypothetical protein BJ508DRAFT_410943, partial [Ascobolus immersus RN42]
MLVIGLWAHAAFENIHPFPDGNGRVGRLFSSLLLGMGRLEPMTIAQGREYEDYIDALTTWGLKGNLGPLIESYFNSVQHAYSVLEEVLV